MPQMEKNTERHSQRTALSFSYEYWFPFQPENPPKTLQSAAAYKVMFFFVLHSGPIQLWPTGLLFNLQLN